MKKLIKYFCMVILISFSTSYGQEQTIAGELSFRILNNNGSTIKVEYELISMACWNAPIHNITEDFNSGSRSTSQNGNNVWLEFLACWESDPLYDSYTFGLGYYKFTLKVNGVIKDYFYIDYRTSTLPENFKVYYNQHLHGYPPGTFSLLTTLSFQDYAFTDLTATLGNGVHDKSYYITAVYTDNEESTQETVPTNYVTVQLTSSQQKRIAKNNMQIDYDYLRQNYPNPFNPSTKIEYHVTKDAFVSLII